MVIRLSDIPEINAKAGDTPSQYAFPVFALCPPVYAGTSHQNNPTMKEYKGKDAKIDKDKFMAQWYNFYNVIAANALVYVLTPVKGLEDQVFVNSFCYLPHFSPDTIILSNFTAEGRPGEEVVAGGLFQDLGYKVIRSPYKFEGDAELKFLRDDIYLGGHGFRTDIRTYQWLESEYGCRIIPIRETDETLYHLDCSVFVLNDYNVMMCAELMDRETVRKIEQIANVIPVSKPDAYAGICNSVKVQDCIYNASSLEYMRRTDDGYAEEVHKNDTMERICGDIGFETIYFDISETQKCGGMLSCFVGNLCGEKNR
jgi:N-dimethylarginine dimethylaminohydrolase